MLDVLDRLNLPGAKAIVPDGCWPEFWFMPMYDNRPSAVRTVTIGKLIRLGLVEAFNGKTSVHSITSQRIAIISEKGREVLEEKSH